MKYIWLDDVAIRLKSGTTQKLYDFTWTSLIMLHGAVWGIEAFMWPWTYFQWPKFNKIYILLWNTLGQWAGLGTIGFILIMLGVSLNEAEILTEETRYGHKGKNNSPDTDFVSKDDVRYTIAMYISVESMYLISWFMYGQDALAYYSPNKERYQYNL